MESCKEIDGTFVQLVALARPVCVWPNEACGSACGTQEVPHFGDDTRRSTERLAQCIYKRLAEIGGMCSNRIRDERVKSLIYRTWPFDRCSCPRSKVTDVLNELQSGVDVCARLIAALATPFSA